MDCKSSKRVRKTEIINAHGHELIQSRHRTTFEITKDEILTERGECIIAVNADKSAADLGSDFKEYARKADARITITIETDEIKETVEARGHPKLSFTHPKDIVVRKSTYICGRTVAILADKAASDLSKGLVKRLQSPHQRVKITLTVDIG